ncbi:MAG: hypothetical protein DRN17_03440 [Thermoplasmata archaeon]|nr:MAG: hypothetical protein DRN17_03440 [Thermoplasmata archaeon]
MNVFDKLFRRKKIKYNVLVWNGEEWTSILEGYGTARSIDDVKKDVQTMIQSGYLSKKMKYKVVDKYGNVLLMNEPEEEGKEEKYRIEYKLNPNSRWVTYDEYAEEPDIDIIDSMVNSGKFQAGSRIRLVRMYGRRKEVLYEVTVPGIESPSGVVTTGGDVIMLDLKQLQQLKQTIDALKTVRDTIDDITGEKKGTSMEYEGKPPWYLHPDFVKSFLPYLLGGIGNTNTGNTKNAEEELNKYLE